MNELYRKRFPIASLQLKTFSHLRKGCMYACEDWGDEPFLEWYIYQIWIVRGFKTSSFSDSRICDGAKNGNTVKMEQIAKYREVFRTASQQLEKLESACSEYLNEPPLIEGFLGR